MSGIFSCACLANYVLQRICLGGLEAINANTDLQRQFCA
jgi:hypothetical protein